MSQTAPVIPQSWNVIESQAVDVRHLSDAERDSLIVSATLVDDMWIVLSHYRDAEWKFSDAPPNTQKSEKSLNFTQIPAPFQSTMKAVLYRYLRRGRKGQRRPKLGSLRKLFVTALPFLHFINKLKLKQFGEITPLVCSLYATECREHRVSRSRQSKPLSPLTLTTRLIAVEALHELSQFTHDKIPQHPWPETSAYAISEGVGKRKANNGYRCKTPRIPDEVFSTLFQQAHAVVERGNELLDLRDALETIATQHAHQHYTTIKKAKSKYLIAQGWQGPYQAFNQALTELRTACYIVIASTSGCRNHELSYLQNNACHITEDDEGNAIHWMRARSDKGDIGICDWMIPAVAVQALRVMERWALPYQTKIAAEIERRRAADPFDPEIAEAQKHRHALFLGEKAGKPVRSLKHMTWSQTLNDFAKNCGLEWGLSSHQFRRTFAHYAAYSRFGDLRYLREHFKHCSQDMANGYAVDDKWGMQFDLDLYEEIQTELDDIKLGVVEQWLRDEPLGGGYGKSLVTWRARSENIALFKSHAAMVKSIAESTAIRSNGHAWCTADEDGCIGNTLEKTRCSGCSNAVIGRLHAPIYQHLYNDLKDLLKCDEIGPGGLARVHRDIARCRGVLIDLGYEPEEIEAL